MTILAQEPFTGTGALSASWTSDTNQDGPFTRVADVGVPSPLGYSAAFWTALSWPNDQYSMAIIATAGTVTDQGTGVICRGATGSNGNLYLDQTNTHEIRKYKRVGGSYTQLASDGAAFANGDILYASSVGSSHTSKKGGAGGTTVVGPVTDSAITAGNAGIWGVNNGTLNDWEGGDFAGGFVPYQPNYARAPIMAQ